MNMHLGKPKHVLSSSILTVLFFTIHYLYSAMILDEKDNILLTLIPPPCIFLSLMLLFFWADKQSEKAELILRNSPSKPFHLWKQYFVLIIICWIPYYIMCFPGNMYWDTGTSILYNLGIDKSNPNNPWFQNIIAGLAYRFGVLFGKPIIGITIYVLLQFLSQVALLSYSLTLQHKNQLLSLMLLFLYICIPVFPIYTLTMGKDSNFALSVMLYVCMTLRLVQNPNRFFENRLMPLFLTVSLTLMGLFRNFAIYIPSFSLILYSFHILKEKRQKQCVIIIVSFSVFTCILLPNISGIPNTEIRETLSIPLQQTAYYYLNYQDELESEEIEKIAEVISLDALQQYNPAISDPIKNQFIPNPSIRQLQDYFSVWAHQFLRHPVAYLKAFYLHTYAYYTPSAIRNDIKPHVFLGFNTRRDLFSETALTPNNNEYLSLVSTIDSNSLSIPILDYFSKIGIYSWLLLITIVRLIQIKQTRYMLCLAPIIMIFFGCLFSPVNGYYRYAYSMIINIPILFSYVMQLETREIGIPERRELQ